MGGVRHALLSPGPGPPSIHPGAAFVASQGVGSPSDRSSPISIQFVISNLVRYALLEVSIKQTLRKSLKA